MTEKTLYERLGGYDGITEFVNTLLPRLQKDNQLGRFWQHRGNDGVNREKQLLIDYLCANAGGALYYTGRNMKLTHEGMNISESDWDIFIGHAVDAMNVLHIPAKEQSDIAAFVSQLKSDIVEC
ncbi:group I truncated hemoglobin [Sessilibacter corallicola]|uniref:Group 1 truncated hemoglobin n=1 Tax=Sessilibacter corallicola TaxID=2904075 RepID=A0ABQ0ACD6_9GAMM|nr:group 1 truncated hemoglobin [Sessilibacter corallicola]MCE2029801.1 group 1 truncated hemoglobin [Sessilibacter corallicola]